MKTKNLFNLVSKEPQLDRLALLKVLEAIIGHNIKGNILEWKALAKELDQILDELEQSKNK